VELAIRNVSWEFHSDVGDTDPRLELLDDARDATSHSWNDHISEVLTMLPFGFSIFEIVYKRDERNRLLWRKFAIRGQDTVRRWLFDDSGGLAGFEQQTPDYRLIPIPIEKLILYRTRVERNNPEGRSMLRTAWIPYYRAKHIEQIEGIGIERDLAGLPVVTLPPGADTANTSGSDFGKASQMVRNIRNDEQAGVILPSADWNLELLSTGGTRQFDTDKIVRRYESRILMSMLHQFLMLGQDSVGSFALSKDQSDFAVMIVNAIADIIAETFTKYAVPRLLALNGYDADGIRFEHTPAGSNDVTAISDFLQKAGSFITWSAEDEQWLRQYANLPERDPQELAQQRAEADAQKQAAREALMQRLQQGGQSQDGQQPDSQQKMTIELLQADAPDDAQRLKRERQWEKALQAYFDEALPRVLTAARKMKG
jgi:hypothetical protein